jgi:uncharacterized protein YbcV (DUF1398 family)
MKVSTENDKRQTTFKKYCANPKKADFDEFREKDEEK